MTLFYNCIDNAWRWYKQHSPHVDKLVDSYVKTYGQKKRYGFLNLRKVYVVDGRYVHPPTQPEDLRRPELWKGFHWLWLMARIDATPKNVVVSEIL